MVLSYLGGDDTKAMTKIRNWREEARVHLFRSQCVRLEGPQHKLIPEMEHLLSLVPPLSGGLPVKNLIE